MTHDVECHFICLFAISISSLVRTLFRCFTHFSSVLSCCLVLIVFCIFLIQIIYQICLSKYFLPVCGLSSHSFKSVIGTAKVCNFKEVQLIYFSFMDLAFDVVSKNFLSIPRLSRFSPMFYFRILHFTLRSETHFELIFVESIRSLSIFIF